MDTIIKILKAIFAIIIKLIGSKKPVKPLPLPPEQSETEIAPLPEVEPKQPKAATPPPPPDLLDLAQGYIASHSHRVPNRSEILTITEFSILPRGLETQLAWLVCIDIIHQHGIYNNLFSKVEHGHSRLTFKRPLPNDVSEREYIVLLCEESLKQSDAMNRHRAKNRLELARHRNMDLMFCEKDFPFADYAIARIKIPDVIHEKYRSRSARRSRINNRGWTSPVEPNNPNLTPGNWFIYLGYGERYPDHQHYGNLRKMFHSGLDYNLPNDEDLGKPFYAMRDGVVEFAGPGQGSLGNMIIVKHNWKGVEYRARYLHAKEMMVNAGDTVTQGAVLGTIGTSNGRWQAHLHIDISKGQWLLHTPSLSTAYNTQQEIELRYEDIRGLLVS